MRPEGPSASARAGGVIFLVSNETWPECWKRSLLGMQHKHRAKVCAIREGTTLFAYNFNERALYDGLYATSNGAERIDPSAWNGKFPFQVRFGVRALRKIELPRIASQLIWEPTAGGGRREFHLELSADQVAGLLRSFDRFGVKIQ